MSTRQNASGSALNPDSVAPHDQRGVQPQHESLPLVMRELAWMIHRSAPARSGGPLPTTEIALLKQVLDAPGSTVGDLATVLGVRQPNVSAGLRSLEQRGFVRRVKSETDRRVTRIMATELGAAEHQEISEAWMVPLQNALQSLSPATQNTLAAAAPALQQLHEQMRTRL